MFSFFPQFSNSGLVTVMAVNTSKKSKVEMLAWKN